jgi:putative endonuclease
MPAYAGIPDEDTKFMSDEKHPAIYIMADRYRGTLYVGVTSALWNRVANHKNGSMPGFTTKYGIKTLVWYEHRHSMEFAIRREKQIKAWKRDWKIKMIEKMNPDWLDLHDCIDMISTLVEEEAGSQPTLG